jgi:hypothetical protein
VDVHHFLVSIFFNHYLTGRATKYQMVRNKKKDALTGVPIFSSVKLELPPIDTNMLCGCISELTKVIIEEDKKCN